MQKSETRRFLEEQFDKYERSRPEQTAPFVSELTEEEAPADEFLQAPASCLLYTSPKDAVTDLSRQETGSKN